MILEISFLLQFQCVVASNLFLDLPLLRFIDGHRLAELDGAGLHLASLLIRLLHDTDDRRLVAKDLVLETGLFLLVTILFLKLIKRCQLDESLSCLLTLHTLEIILSEVELNLFAGFGIHLRLEVEGNALKLFLAHDPSLEDQLVAIEFVLPL